MISILKGASPPIFEDCKAKKRFTETDFLKRKNPFKPGEAREKFLMLKKGKVVYDIVRQCLSAEQSSLCCYCQMRIEIGKTFSIEHLRPLTSYPHKMFNYDNLMGSCLGGSNDVEDNELVNAPELLPKYCNREKGHQELDIHPLMSNCESYFEYEVKRDWIEIKGKKTEAEQAIRILNLNTPKLANLRFKTLKGYLTENGNPIDENEIKMLKTKTTLNPIPFQGALNYFLDNPELIDTL